MFAVLVIRELFLTVNFCRFTVYIFIKFIYSYVQLQVKVYDLAIQSVIHMIGHEWCNVSYSVNLGCYSGFLDGYTYYLGTIKPPIPRSPISVYRRGIINF